MRSDPEAQGGRRNALPLVSGQRRRLLQTKSEIQAWISPRSDLLSKMAKAFGVKLEDLLLSSERPIAKRKGPIGEVQRTFEAVTKLPRKQQRKVLEMVQALVEQYKRKAS